MNEFTLHDFFATLYGPDPTTVENQLLARALKEGHHYLGLPGPIKGHNPATGFKCNYYNYDLKSPLYILIGAARSHCIRTNRNWYTEGEKQYLIKEYFIANIRTL